MRGREGKDAATRPMCECHAEIDKAVQAIQVRIRICGSIARGSCSFVNLLECRPHCTKFGTKKPEGDRTVHASYRHAVPHSRPRHAPNGRHSELRAPCMMLKSNMGSGHARHRSRPMPSSTSCCTSSLRVGASKGRLGQNRHSRRHSMHGIRNVTLSGVRVKLRPSWITRLSSTRCLAPSWQT